MMFDILKDLFGKYYEEDNIDCNIQSITINEKKKVVTVVFTNGDVQITKCSDKDEFDPYIGYAMCLTKHIHKSKTQLKKFVDENAKFIKG